MEITVGRGGLAIECGGAWSKWQVRVIVERHILTLRLPFLGVVGVFKQHDDLPWESARATWADCRQRAEEHEELMQALLWDHWVFQPFRRHEREAEWLRYAQKAGLA